MSASAERSTHLKGYDRVPVFRVIVAVAVALAFAAMASAVPIASAGDYVVGACRDGDSGADAWRQTASPVGFQLVRECPAGPDGGGLQTRVMSYDQPAGTAGGWWFEAPMTTKVVGFSAVAQTETPAHTLAQGWTPGLWDADTGESLQSPFDIWAPVAGPDDRPFAAQRIVVGLRCTGATGCKRPSGDRPRDQWISVRDVLVHVRDDIAPSITVTEAPPAGWRAAGVVPVSVTATDNVGVRDLRISVDGRSVARADARVLRAERERRPEALRGSQPVADHDAGSRRAGETASTRSNCGRSIPEHPRPCRRTGCASTGSRPPHRGGWCSPAAMAGGPRTGSRSAG